MGVSVVIAFIIIIIAVAVGITFVLRESAGRINPLLAILSLLLAGCSAAFCAIGSTAGTVYAQSDGDPQETVRIFFDSVCSGDYPTAYSCLENYSSLGLENTPSAEVGELVYSALRDSYSYELQGPAAIDRLSAKQTVSFTCLDLRAMEADAEAETSKVLEKIVRSRPRKDIYDENNNYYPAVTEEAYRTAVTGILKNASAYYSTRELTVSLDYIDRRWLINADGSLMNALTGGTA